MLRKKKDGCADDPIKRMKSTFDALPNAPSYMKLKDGSLDHERVLYFKGKHAVNALLRGVKSGKKSNKYPKCENRSEAAAFFQECLRTSNIFVPAKLMGKHVLMNVSYVPETAVFDEDEIYILTYEGSKFKSYLRGFLILASIFSFVVIQIWPEKPRKVVYYLSISLSIILIAFLILSIIRAIINLFCRIALGKNLWILPNLFEEVGLKEIFWPLYKVYTNHEGEGSGSPHNDKENEYKELEDVPSEDVPLEDVPQ